MFGDGANQIGLVSNVAEFLFWGSKFFSQIQAQSSRILPKVTSSYQLFHMFFLFWMKATSAADHVGFCATRLAEHYLHLRLHSLLNEAFAGSGRRMDACEVTRFGALHVFTFAPYRSCSLSPCGVADNLSLM